MCQSRRVTNRTVFALAAWTATAAIAVGAGLTAIAEVGAGITDRTVKPMTSAQVKAALAEPVPSTLSPTQTPSVKPPAKPPVRLTSKPAPTVTVTASPTTSNLASEAGYVVASCNQSQPYLLSWTPLQGYSAGQVRRNPPGPVFVQFLSGPKQVIMTISCKGELPLAAVRTFYRHRYDQPGWGV